MNYNFDINKFLKDLKQQISSFIELIEKYCVEYEVKFPKLLREGQYSKSEWDLVKKKNKQRI